MTATATEPDLRQLAERYGDAWNSQDLDAIMELHADDCVFCAYAAGSLRAEGKEAVREAFAGYLALMPDINFAERCLHVGDRHWVLESTMTGTVAGSLEVDGVDPAAVFVAAVDDEAGEGVEVECVDVIEFRDGLITSKHTYLDSLAMHRQLGGES